MTNDPKAPTARRRTLIGSLAAAIALALVTVVPALANPVPTNPDPWLDCPDAHGSGQISKYVTTLTMPADSNDWWVSVDVTIEGADAACELSLATYELPSATFQFPQTLHDAQTGIFGAGTHTLTAALPVPGQMPDCFFQFDFVFGPPIDELVFENRYGDRQIRSRIGPESADQCPVIATTPPTNPPTVIPPVIPPTVIPPVIPPAEGTEGGNPPTVPSSEGTLGGGGLPNTSSAAVSATGVASLIGGLLLLGSLSTVALSGVRIGRIRR